MRLVLNDIFKNSEYDATIFSDISKEWLENKIQLQNDVPYVECIIRKKQIKLTPEEVVRQLFVYELINKYAYPESRIELETGINFGREIKRADIVIWEKDRPNVPYIIFEIKKPKLSEGKEQLKSYCNATGAPMEYGQMENKFQYIIVKIQIILKKFQKFLIRLKVYLM